MGYGSMDDAGPKQNDPENLKTAQKGGEDPVAATIGEMGRWQAARIAILWLVSMPGKCHMWAVAFETIVPPFHCAAAAAGAALQDNTSNVCAAECDEYHFDKSFWENTIPMQFGLICDKFNLTRKQCKAWQSASKLSFLLLCFSTGRGHLREWHGDRKYHLWHIVR